MANIAIVLNESWDETKPAGTRARSLGDDDIREGKRAARERNAIDHQAQADESGNAKIGTHKKVTLSEEQGNDPVAYDDVAYFYTRKVAGILEFFFEDSSGNVKQMSTGGKLNISALEAVLLTADQTIAGIKTFSASPIVPTPTTNMQAATKAYIDAAIAAIPAPTLIGAWALKTVNVVYQAATDGFAVVNNAYMGSDGQYTQILTDASNPPTTIRAKIYVGGGTTSFQGALMSPVKKNDYYKIESNVTPTAIYFIPLGT